MHDLVPVNALPGALTTAEIAAAMGYAEARQSAATKRAYESDWQDFAAWCATRGATPLPAHPGVVAAYLSHLADSGKKASTIGRRCAAIGHRHKIAGVDPLPTASEGVRAVLKGIRRTIGVASTQKAAATASVVRQMLDSCGDDLIGLRDRALISFGLASAMRRSELCALTLDDLVPVPDGLRVLIRRSKTDQEGAGQEIAVPRGLKLRPVECVENWLAAAHIESGPVFRAVLLGGRVQESLTPDGLARIIKKLAARIGMDPTTVAAHSLRSGFVTTCVEANAPLMKVMETTRHKSVQMLQVYSRRIDLFRDHAAASWI
jgi:site-specific recombinase XerD